MPNQQISLFLPFTARKRKNHIAIALTSKQGIASLELNKTTQAQSKEQGFEGKGGQILIIRSDNGTAQSIIAGTKEDPTYEDGSKIYSAIKNAFSKDMLSKTSFEFEEIPSDGFERLHVGWGWAAYQFDKYKKEDKEQKTLSLVLAKATNKARVKALVESVCLIRDLVNTPANDMGPDELEQATKFLCDSHDIPLKAIKDNALLTKNFPMIYEVGKASPRRPRLLDFSWGNSKHPKVTLVGKGVCFDTGGLDIKPSNFMLNMKKDMGGAAQVLGLAHLIISMKLPILLRVLIPAVENSISGEAYRPSDVLKSRKGLSVEVGNTDAEGRLVLADALTYASEDKPELLIDFATLTGAARVALGQALPAMFTTNSEIAYEIQNNSAGANVDDPVWNLPLWAPYKKDLESSIADTSSTGGQAGAITAALFLEQFTDKDNVADWVHMDVFAWEQKGKSGRPKGGSDTGMRAIFAYLEDRYGK